MAVFSNPLGLLRCGKLATHDDDHDVLKERTDCGDSKTPDVRHHQPSGRREDDAD